MGKLKKTLNSFKTYGKKTCTNKKYEIQVCLNRITDTNYAKSFKSLSDGRTSQSVTNSEDEFDKLFNKDIVNSSEKRLSPCSERFNHRQNLQSHYKSDVSCETSSSVHLFKGYDSSKSLSLQHSPASYRRQNKQIPKMFNPFKKYRNNRLLKTKRKKYRKRLVNTHEKDTVNKPVLVASTPNHPQWSEENRIKMENIVSPIMTLEDEPLGVKETSVNPLDISVLVERMGKLGIMTPRHKDSPKRSLPFWRRHTPFGDSQIKQESSKHEKENLICSLKVNETDSRPSSARGSIQLECINTSVRTPNVNEEKKDNQLTGSMNFVMECLTNLSGNTSSTFKSKIILNVDSNINPVVKEDNTNYEVDRHSFNTPPTNNITENELKCYEIENEVVSPTNDVSDYCFSISNLFSEHDSSNYVRRLTITDTNEQGNIETKETKYCNHISGFNENLADLDTSLRTQNENIHEKKPRLSVIPGKQWKRSLLLYTQKDKTNPLSSSIGIRRRRSFVHPSVLAKLIGNGSRQSFSFQLDNDSSDMLPILLDGAMSTITKRRKPKIVEVMDILEEDFPFETCINFTLDPEDNLQNRSCDMFQEEEDFNLELEDELDDVGIKLGVLARCGQDQPLPFSEVFPDSVLSDCKKIGEGVFGEVFLLRRSPDTLSVIKVIPIEGNELVNGEPQKLMEEVLSELIISEELTLLSSNQFNCTTGFCRLKNKYCVQGLYPEILVDLWKEYAAEEKSENDCPAMFGPEQLYMVLELEHVGEPVETYRFNTAQQAMSVFLQTTFALAIAECALQFEHRDLHVGNILIKNVPADFEYFNLNGCTFQVPTFGVKATMIDFTLSRMTFEGNVLFCDLSKDPEMFNGEGDYQFEIYRLMKQDLNNNWREHTPYSNIRWLDYLVDKMTGENKNCTKYKKVKSVQHKKWLSKLRNLREVMIDFSCCCEFAQYLLETYQETVDLIDHLKS